MKALLIEKNYFVLWSDPKLLGVFLRSHYWNCLVSKQEKVRNGIEKGPLQIKLLEAKSVQLLRFFEPSRVFLGRTEASQMGIFFFLPAGTSNPGN